MSGIAGYLGPRPEGVDVSSAYRGLSYTGRERMAVEKSGRFLGLAVSYGEEGPGPGALREGDGICILLDGHITRAGGRDQDPADPLKALRACARLYREHGAGFARELNGSFALCVYDGRDASVCLVADRLSTRPLRFTRSGGALVFSTSLEAVFSMAPGFRPELSPTGLAEFLYFSRLPASNMWEGLERVPPGTALTFGEVGMERHVYWECRFSYRRGERDLAGNAERLAGALREACSRRAGSAGGVGLLLSGGMDSRTLLACLPEETVCYTSCDLRNHETRLAGRAARVMGRRHHLLQRGPLHYLDILPEAARTAEGAAEYHHSHITGLTSGMREVTGGAVLHGLGFDSILKGAYLPRVTWHLAGKRARPPVIRRYRSGSELVEGLLELGLARPRALDLLTPRLRGELRDHPRQVARAFVEDNAGAAVDPVDVPELFVIKDISRWETFPFVAGLRHHLPERWVATDDQIMEVVLVTPPEMRFDARLLRKTLSLLEPRLADIPNASTFLPARAGNMFMTAGFLPSLLHRRVYAPLALRTTRRGARPWTLTPGPWHDLDGFWRYGPIAGRLLELLSDPAAMRDEALDAGAVRNAVEAQRRGDDYWTFPLARVATFLEWRRACPV